MRVPGHVAEIGQQCGELVETTTLGVLVRIDMDGDIGETEWRPQPEELRSSSLGGAPTGALADRSNAPRAVTAAGEAERPCVEMGVVDADGALPVAELGDPCVVEDRDDTTGLEEAGFDCGDREQ